MNARNQGINWKPILRIGAATALGAVLVGLVEISLTFLPGGDANLISVMDWLLFFQDHPGMGLRNLGLLNILLNTLAIFSYLGIYAAYHKHREQPLVLLVVVIAFLGSGVFLATNRAFPMHALSQAYAQAGSDAERLVIEGAGQALLAVGESHSAGTFLAFFLAEVAGLSISLVMVPGDIFPRAAGISGALGFSLLLLFEFLSSFGSGPSGRLMILAGVGGILSMVWYLLLARTMLQLAGDKS